MGILPPRLNEKRRQIGKLAGAKAFESFLRHGRVPAVYTELVEATETEQKFLDFFRPNISAKALGDDRPTMFYTWRTVHDDRVRSSHAANDGRVFGWADPPPTGHPGTEPNCRCWPEPYHGDPARSDDSLLLTREVRAGNDDEPWSSVETLRRPNGSLAEALVVASDGVRVRSTYRGDRVTHEVTLADDRKVMVESVNGIQTIYLGEQRNPVSHSRWGSDGLIVKRPRVAFSGNLGDLLDLDDFDDLLDLEGPLDDDVLPIGNPFNFDPDDPLADALWYAGAALLMAGSRRSAKTDNVVAVGYKVWEKNEVRRLVATSVQILSKEQIEQTCKRLGDVQAWTDEAAKALAALKPTMLPREWGTQVHKWVEQRIKALQLEAPELYADLSAERSFDPSPTTPIPRATYGQLGSWRLDVVEEVREDLFCVYDIKTGKRGIEKQQRDGAFTSIEKLRPGATILVIEVRPTE
jgi:hypothetical protein